MKIRKTGNLARTLPSLLPLLLVVGLVWPSLGFAQRRARRSVRQSASELTLRARASDTGLGLSARLALYRSRESLTGENYLGVARALESSNARASFDRRMAESGRTIRMRPGDYVLEVKANGYQTMVSYVRLESNEPADIVVWLDRLDEPSGTATIGPDLFTTAAARSGRAVLHFEIKNRTALTSVPFSGCTNTPRGVYISAGYSGKRNDYSGGDSWDPSNDNVRGNLLYHPSRFIQQRLSLTGFRPMGDAALTPVEYILPTPNDGLARCEEIP